MYFVVDALVDVIQILKLSNNKRSLQPFTRYMGSVAIDLCCGSKSFSKTMKRLFPFRTVYTVDIDRSCDATFVGNVLDWDYKNILPRDQHNVTHLWASPPCTQYSIMRSTGPPRDIEGANRIVQRVLEIVQYYNTDCFGHARESFLWYIENPIGSLLKRQTFMEGLPFYDVSYCAYESDWGMRKGTRIWTNKRGFTPRVCPGPGRCSAMVFHEETGRYRHRCTVKGRFWLPEWRSQKDKQKWMGRVPEQLITDLVV